MTLQRTISPVDGRVVVERELAGMREVDATLARAAAAQRGWRATPLERRQDVLTRFVAAMEERAEEIARELAWQMGRPVSAGPLEIRRGFAERSRHLIETAPAALAEQAVPPKAGFHRFVRREPVGVVFVVAPWNYPYLTSVNWIVPALLAGNAVLLKASAQTPTTADRYAEAFAAAGLPEHVFQFLHLDHDSVERVIGDPRVGFVAFTGSVAGGRAIQAAAARRFVRTGLELGGKDAAYVRRDADLDDAAAQLVDGAMFNSGQSCCGIKRIYVHQDVHDGFVERAVALARQYVLGDPLEPATTLGPLAKASAAAAVREQVAAAVAQGARPLVDEHHFPASRSGTAYLAPQLLAGATPNMAVMAEETFGPVAALARVRDDDEAVERMNDSRFGLTAAIFTADERAAVALGERLDVGTCFVNRCDYVDPALAWTGVKESGLGAALGTFGFEALTRPKSYHARRVTK